MLDKSKTLNPLLAKFKKTNSTKKTVEHLLTVEEVANKYFKSVTKLHIEKYVQTLRPQEVEDFKKLFAAFKSGLRFTNRVYQGVDKGGRPYIYPKFFSPKGDVECKIFPLGKLTTMMADYQAGKFAINFKAEDLVEHLFNR
nr:hypothetical protein [Pedobacter nyackensis]